MKPEISIAIVSCDRPRSLRKAILSIKKFVKVPYEIVVLDVTKNFTQDANFEWHKKQVDKWIEKDTPVGIGEGYQMVADLCDTKYVFHMDDDMFFNGQDVLSAEYEYIKENPDIGIVGCCWYDHTYGEYREAAMTWLIGEHEGKKSFRKVPIPMQYARRAGDEMDVVESFEALHGMLINKELVYDKGAKWDANLPAKGDREAFFMNCYKAGVKIRILTNQIMHHDMTPYEHGSQTLKYPGRESKEYFYKEYGLWPLEYWDKNRPRVSSDGRRQMIECE